MLKCKYSLSGFDKLLFMCFVMADAKTQFIRLWNLAGGLKNLETPSFSRSCEHKLFSMNQSILNQYLSPILCQYI